MGGAYRKALDSIYRQIDAVWDAVKRGEAPDEWEDVLEGLYIEADMLMSAI